MSTSDSLGTLLRTLIERLDGDVEQRYIDDGLEYRPRFTPVVRALKHLGPSSIATIARHIGMRHSAVSQTVAQMERHQLITYRPGKDARERLVEATPKLHAMQPRLDAHWRATTAAATSLESDLPHPLAATVKAALEALDRQSFADRARDHFQPKEEDI